MLAACYGLTLTDAAIVLIAMFAGTALIADAFWGEP
jgi:hypothetical protein